MHSASSGPSGAYSGPDASDPGADGVRASLDDYELNEDDRAILDSPGPAPAAGGRRPSDPLVAVMGRPNVGKSTLVNRILGRRAAVVLDTPGVTRDRVSYPAEWAGRRFTLVDTGGWEARAQGLERAVSEQAEAAVATADAVLLVVDAVVGATGTDEQLAAVLRRSGRPVVLAANKVDSAVQEADASALWSLGLGEPHPVSGLHGRGSGDLLDALVAILPQHSRVVRGHAAEEVHRVALVGRPNVGKSSLLNALVGGRRAVVSEAAGTTRDPVDEVVQLGGRPWRFVDTAGIRRRPHRTSGADYYAQVRTRAAIERAEVALVLLDASQDVAEQDVRVIQQVVDAGRALVLVNNKWDLVDAAQQRRLRVQADQQLAHVEWAPRVNVSALTAWHTNRIAKALEAALTGWRTRVSTGRLNAFLGRLQAEHPHPVRGGKQARILFGTQVSVCPPRVVLFTTGFLEPAYRRFLERRLREDFGFEGSPLRISVRPRERRRR